MFGSCWARAETWLSEGPDKLASMRVAGIIRGDARSNLAGRIIKSDFHDEKN